MDSRNKNYLPLTIIHRIYGLSETHWRKRHGDNFIRKFKQTPD